MRGKKRKRGINTEAKLWGLSKNRVAISWGEEFQVENRFGALVVIRSSIWDLLSLRRLLDNQTDKSNEQVEILVWSLG